MGKRKHYCSLDEIVIECLKKAKYERTLKLFQKQDSNKCSNATYAGFVAFLKKGVVETKTKDDDDLGFEINFGAFQCQKKVRFGVSYKYRGSAFEQHKKLLVDTDWNDLLSCTVPNVFASIGLKGVSL